MGMDWQWGASNCGPEVLGVWLEPWADEFEVPARSTITLKILPFSEAKFVEIEVTEGGVLVWANSGDAIEVYIDQILQKSASATIAVPEGMTKQMLNVVFGQQPTARLGGRSPPRPGTHSFWQGLKRRLGLR